MTRWKTVTYADWRAGHVYSAPDADSGSTRNNVRWFVMQATDTELRGYVKVRRTRSPLVCIWARDPSDAKFLERPMLPRERLEGIKLMIAEAAGVAPCV